MLAAALAGAQAITAAPRGESIAKADGTPQTAADLASDAAIRASLLRDIPEIPVVSEETQSELPADFADRPFLLVDPLDGTREYLAGHPDHAVCIALIEGRRPVLGVIVAPMLRKAWTAGAEAREYGLTDGLALSGEGRPLHVAADGGVHRVVTSRSRPDAVAAAIMRHHPAAMMLQVGAVLKLVAVATGEACLFPTENPSSEWDIAAGEALVIAAGGAMLGRDGLPLTYGRSDEAFLNAPFAAGASLAIVEAALAQWPAKSSTT